MTTIEELEAVLSLVKCGEWESVRDMYPKTIEQTLTQAIAIKKGGMVVVPRQPETKHLKAMLDCGSDAPFLYLYEAIIAAQEERG